MYGVNGAVGVNGGMLGAQDVEEVAEHEEVFHAGLADGFLFAGCLGRYLGGSVECFSCSCMFRLSRLISSLGWLCLVSVGMLASCSVFSRSAVFCFLPSFLLEAVNCD